MGTVQKLMQGAMLADVVTAKQAIYKASCEYLEAQTGLNAPDGFSSLEYLAWGN